MNRFKPGDFYVTPGALRTFTAEQLTEAQLRHLDCDWGDLSEFDKKENDESVKLENDDPNLGDYPRLLSAYRFGEEKLWIITEADRSSTTMLLPEEY